MSLRSGPSSREGTAGSRTVTATAATPPVEGEASGSQQQAGEAGSDGILRLRGSRSPRSRRVVWTEETVDNEGLGRKKSKICCIYHKPRAFDESSSESSSSDSGSDSDSDSDSSAASDSAQTDSEDGDGPRLSAALKAKRAGKEKGRATSGSDSERTCSHDHDHDHDHEGGDHHHHHRHRRHGKKGKGTKSKAKGGSVTQTLTDPAEGGDEVEDGRSDGEEGSSGAPKPNKYERGMR